MATDNLLSVDIISAVIQSGNGIPNHIGTRGTFYIDVDTGISYQNKDNINTWLKFLYEGDASGSGGISGSGTINYIPKWSSASGLTNSRIIDNGTLITLSGNSSVIGSLSAITYYGDGSNLTGIPYITGGTYSSSTGQLIFYSNTGSAFSVSGTYSFENSAYKQNSMTHDGTGTKYPTVDAVNTQANDLAKAIIKTGFVDVNDAFTLYKYDNNTLGISGTNVGIVFSQLFKTPPIAPSSAIVQLTSRLVPLSNIGLTADTNTIKFVGYRQSDDSILFSNTTFIQSQTVCQLGVVLVKYNSGVTSFIDNDRTFVNQPDIAAYSNLSITSLGLKSNVIISNLTNNLRIKNTGGSLIGISTNWHGNNNDLLPISASDITTGTTFTYIYPVQSITATPPNTAFLIDPTVYWNGTALVSTGNNQSATVQRFLVTIRGHIVVQYGETAYASFTDASNNASVQVFTDILPAGTAIEVGRLVVTKSATDLSNSTIAHFINTSGGGGGGGTSSTVTWGNIQGSIFDQSDLVANFQQILTNPVTGTGTGTTNTLTKWSSSSGITDSNISDDGTLVTISSNTNVVGSISGNSFVVTNGTSDQFLKADGSTDSKTYTDGIFQQDITVSLSNGKTMGKYTTGQVIPAAGRTFEQVIRDIAIEFQVPSFASFSISSQATLIEVGTALSGTKSFTWAFNNTFNVSANTMSIIDVTSGNTILRSGISITPPIVIDIGVKSNTVPISQSWKGTAVDTNSTPMTSGLFTVTSIYPFFYGVSVSAPTPNQALINSGAKSVSVSTGTISVTFGASLQYLWFAIPQSSTDKTKWFVDALNNGNIGTGTDLFNNETIVSINSPTALWNGVNYRIYISNYATTTSGVMQLQN